MSDTTLDLLPGESQITSYEIDYLARLVDFFTDTTPRARPVKCVGGETHEERMEWFTAWLEQRSERFIVILTMMLKKRFPTRH